METAIHVWVRKGTEELALSMEKNTQKLLSKQSIHVCTVQKPLHKEKKMVHRKFFV